VPSESAAPWMPRERWYWVAAWKSCFMPFARSAGRTRSDECSRGKSRWSIRNVMPPPQPEVRMRSVGRVTGWVNVTSARPSTGETSTRAISSTSPITFSIQR